MLEWTFDDLYAAVRALPTVYETKSHAPSIHRRLLDVLSEAHAGQPRSRDIAALARQVLRREIERGAPDATLWLPDSLIQPPILASHSLRGAKSGTGLNLRASWWRPEWIGENPRDPAAVAIAEHERRLDERVPADPFIERVLGLATYTGPGQKQAVRAALSGPSAATLIVNLPTGSGKTLVGLAPALVEQRIPGTTVVVVPTTALALDQERRLQGELGHERFAYHQALDEVARGEVRRRIRDGSQRVVFCSPESLLKSLAHAVFDAAENGRIRALVIDEAHIIAQWGDEFRPEFQALAGMRRALLREQSFPTILLSATMTEEAIEVCRVLFGQPGPIEYVASVSIRPEPEYWVADAQSEEQRELWLFDAVAHLPRPLIIYASRVADVKRWSALLQDVGYGRVASVHGGTPDRERQRVIRRWRGDGTPSEIDVVVATSAFGLGIDQDNVRGVVHACLPETVDRFYQEVGRGGRDGRACVSLLLTSPADAEVARGLNRTKIITVRRGFERWEAMSAKAEHADAKWTGLMRLPLTARPPDIFRTSRENEAWNLRTLVLMARSGLLELHGVRPPRPDSGDDSIADEAFEAFRTSTVVAVREAAYDEAEWNRLVEPERRKMIDWDRESLRLMFRCQTAQDDFGVIFADAYRVGAMVSLSAETLPGRACGGCPDCRRQARAPYRALSPQPLRVAARGEPDDVLAALLPHTSVVTAWYEPPVGARATRTWRHQIAELTRLLAEHGVRCVVMSQRLLSDDAILEATARRAVFVERALRDAALLPRLPTLVVLDLEANGIAPAALYANGGRLPSPRICVVPGSMRDPERPMALIRETRLPSYRLDELLSRL